MFIFFFFFFFSCCLFFFFFFFFSSRRRHTRSKRDWSSDVCSSDLRICRAHLGQRCREHGVAGPPRLHLRQQQILQPVRVPQGLSQARGHAPLSAAQHVPHVLGVGIQAERRETEVAVQHVAPLDHHAGGIRE